MDALADMLTAPLEPWDALICTSKAVIDSVEVLLGAARQDLAERLGATRFASPQLVTIPLGVNTSDFAASHEHRKAWREKLDIPQDAIVALYVGRLSPAGKMNPAPMALALEAAAQETGRDIYWIVSGWAGTPEFSQAYHDQTRALCPSIHYRSIDGRPADTRFSIWSAADLFISLPENIQETFGLTPIEAMAAGLPCVVTDWNGYRDTVRDGLDGFRVATTAPRPSLGRDLAYAHANEWVNYDQYISAAAAVIAIDLRAATQALVQLITQPDLRRRMGETALRQAREVFDWATIIPQYQALWGELAARRTAVTPTANPHDNPRKLDPFKLFAGYPTQALSPQTKVCVVPGMTWPVAEARLGSPLGIIGHWALPFPPERKVMFEYFQAHGSATVADMLADITPRRRPFMERGVLWLVKFGILEFV